MSIRKCAQFLSTLITILFCIVSTLKSCFFPLSDDSKFDENNKLKANEYLQIEGLDGIYAIGDCTNKTSHAGAALAGMHAQHVVSNLIREIKGQSLLAWPGPSKFLNIYFNVRKSTKLY